jgi:hypothetical protein
VKEAQVLTRPSKPPTPAFRIAERDPVLWVVWKAVVVSPTSQLFASSMFKFTAVGRVVPVLVCDIRTAISTLVINLENSCPDVGVRNCLHQVAHAFMQPAGTARDRGGEIGVLSIFENQKLIY